MTRPTTTGKAQDLITFTRSTTGTYLDSVTYGDELVTNGTFDNNIDGWTSVNANLSASNGGMLIADNGSFSVAYQAVSTVIGKTYIIYVDAIDVPQLLTFNFGQGQAAPTGSNAYFDGTGEIINNLTVVGSFQHIFTAVATTTYISFGTNSINAITIDNVSVKELTGGQGTQGTPLLRTSAINEARIEYDASGNCLGLLVEEARTNLRTYSEDFSNGVWAKSSSASLEHGFESLDGGTSASKLTFSETGTNQLLFTYATQTGVHSFSIYMKAGEPSDVGKTVRLDSTGGGATGKPITLTNEWQRVSISPTPTGYFQLRIISSGGMTASSVLLFGGQLEAGSFPTSYIPTSGSAVTRAADVASLAVSEFGYNQDQGTVFINCLITEQATANKRVIDGNSNNKRWMYVNNPDNNYGLKYFDGTNNITLVSSGIPLNMKAAVAVIPTQVFGAANSSDVGNGAHNGDLLDISQFNFFANLTGHIKSVQYYPLRLSNAQLQALTV